MMLKLFFFCVTLCKLAFCDVKYIDLSWKFDESTVYWVGARKFEFTKVSEGSERGFWYAGKEFCAAEHGGTHLDAPYHFNQQGWKVGDIPLDRLIVPGVLVDMSNYTDLHGANTTLQVHHLENWVREHGKIPSKSVVLVKFNWSQFYNNETKYLGSPTPLFPGISKEAAEWLGNSTADIVGVGVDTPSVDPGYANIYPTHQVLGKHQMYGLENVKLIKSLPAKGFKLFVMPMYIKTGTGAPLRLIAEVKDTCN